jgi:hypothetical protein
VPEPAEVAARLFGRQGRDRQVHFLPIASAISRKGHAFVGDPMAPGLRGTFL